ncbi:MAG: hypothetical protein JOZ69_05570 [Myxococcales bacterium]|nr:hypothetical protein [Myxococcales bacterium]
MSSFPHRWSGSVETPRRPEPARDADLLFIALVFWVVSVVRAAGALFRHETFGAESTLALAAAVAIPWVVLRARRRAQD